MDKRGRWNIEDDTKELVEELQVGYRTLPLYIMLSVQDPSRQLRVSLSTHPFDVIRWNGDPGHVQIADDMRTMSLITPSPSSDEIEVRSARRARAHFRDLEEPQPPLPDKSALLDRFPT